MIVAWTIEGLAIWGVVHFLWHGTFGARRRRRVVPAAVRQAIDEARIADIQRVESWAANRGLVGEHVFTGLVDGRRVELDPKRDASAQRGPDLIVRAGGLVDQPSLLTRLTPWDRHPLQTLFHHPELAVPLHAIEVTPGGVRFRFGRLTSTEALDVVLREMNAILYAPRVRPREPLGPYR